MGFLLWEEGSGKQDLRVMERWGFLCQIFWEIATCVNLGGTLKGLRGVENAAVAVEGSSVLDVKSGTALIISFGRVLVFNCSLKATILVTNRWNGHRSSRIFWKNPEIYSSHCFSHWNVPCPFPMLSHAYFEALRPLWYPNKHWGRGNGHKCFKILDDYCRYLFCNWKYRLAFSSSWRSFRESMSSMLPCITCIAGRSGTG